MIGDFLKKYQKLVNIKDQIVKLIDEVGAFFEDNKDLFVDTDNLEREITQKNNELFAVSAEIDKASEKIKAIEEEQGKVIADYKIKAEKDHKEFTRVADAENKRIDEANADLSSKLKQYRKDLNDLKSNQNQLISNQEQYSLDNEKCIDQKAENEKEKNRLNILSTDLSVKEEELQSKEEDVCYMTEGIGKERADLEKATEGINDANAEIEQTKINLKKEKMALDERDKELDSKEAAYNKKVEKLDKFEKELVGKEESLKGVRANLDAKDKNLKNLQNELEIKQGELKALETKLRRGQ